MRSLGIRTDGKTGSMVYQDRPGEPDCVYYLRTGMCGYGDNCKFNHPTFNGQVKVNVDINNNNNQHGGSLPERAGEPDCVYFLKTGACKYGSSCKYNHPKDRNGAPPVVLNAIGFPMRQEQKSCPHYLRTGSCKFGLACKFHHPQPVLDGLKPPVCGPMPYGPAGAPPYVGSAVPWPYSTPQTYLPVMLPPSGPARGWGPYYGNMSLILSTNGLTSVDHVYQSTPSSNLPVRPGEPKCRHFMNTGACKYGSDCKYHHPQEKMVLSGAGSLGLFGLPLRPGQPICVYHSLYGMCKYGSGCKYDHPFVVYSYNYVNGLTSQPLDGSSLLTYGGMTSPDSSPSKTLKNLRLTSEPHSNGKVCTDESSGEHEHAGSSHSSSSHNQSD
ncbi:zinc finger CCCH domain-containing protein 3-like isoform X2 [Bidens hawaiensis]|uniref:zinc finger CCCH domain-containing protein 3-like isoform X2 n=1 Tax=Bidens hawaiensis TaxID=980011 RepID=UPI00404B8C0B